MTKITLGELPVRPERDQASGLTTKMWNGLTECWHTKPEDRITIPEALKLFNSQWVLPFVAQMIRMYSWLDPRVQAGGSALGPYESAVGTSTRALPSNTLDFRRSVLRASHPTEVASRHPPNHRTHPVRWSETTSANTVRSNHSHLTDEPITVSHPTPAPTRPSKTFLKRRGGIFVIRLRPSFANTFSSFLPPLLHIRRRYGYVGR